MSGHWDFILAAYGVAAVLLVGYRIFLGRQLRAAEDGRAALQGRAGDRA